MDPGPGHPQKGYLFYNWLVLTASLIMFCQFLSCFVKICSSLAGSSWFFMQGTQVNTRQLPRSVRTLCRAAADLNWFDGPTHLIGGLHPYLGWQLVAAGGKGKGNHLRQHMQITLPAINLARRFLHLFTFNHFYTRDSPKPETILNPKKNTWNLLGWGQNVIVGFPLQIYGLRLPESFESFAQALNLHLWNLKPGMDEVRFAHLHICDIYTV